MRKVSLLFLMAVALTSCKEEEQAVVVPEPDPVYHSLAYVVAPDSLADWLAVDTSLQLLDIRKPEQFNSGHIPGAINLWRPEITSKSYPYGGMAIDRDSLAQLLGEKGISNDKKLVFYDGKGGSDAVRMWFLMRLYGHSNMTILDGGLKAWTQSLDTIYAPASPTSFSFSGQSLDQIMATKEDVLGAINDTSVLLVDTRSSNEFTGKRLKKGATKSGRIPKSISWDWGNAVQMETTGLFKSAKDLQYEMDSLGIDRKKEIIVYCHTGVRSAHTYFVLTELLGYSNVQNYDGSWSEWSYFEELPFETDFETPEITK